MEGTSPSLGRRDRKRLATRRRLTRSALELFDERGFDQVTVADIAERADVDPSTFFRHFGSKEAVLFTDMTDFIGHVEARALDEPAGGPLLDQLAAVTDELARDLHFDEEVEAMRARLATSSPTLAAQGLVYRERLTRALTRLIGSMSGRDPDLDPTPYLVALLWTGAFDWYRRRVADGDRAAASPTDARDQVLAVLRPLWPDL